MWVSAVRSERPVSERAETPHHWIADQLPNLGQGSLYHLTFVRIVGLSSRLRWVTFVSLVRICFLALTGLCPYVLTLKGVRMAIRPTPIERAIAGEPVDRQERYRRRFRAKGLVRVTVSVPEARADELRSLAKSWVAGSTGDDD